MSAVIDPVASRIARFTQARGQAAASRLSGEPGLDERRWSARKHRNAPGLIAVDQGHAAVSCVVRDTSSSGARVELVRGPGAEQVEPHAVPDRFTLAFLTPTDQTEVACAVMWRKGRLIGVRYVGPFRTFTKPQRRLNARRT